jgi:hypothetical protein
MITVVEPTEPELPPDELPEDEPDEELLDEELEDEPPEEPPPELAGVEFVVISVIAGPPPPPLLAQAVTRKAAAHAIGAIPRTLAMIAPSPDTRRCIPARRPYKLTLQFQTNSRLSSATIRPNKINTE